MDRIIRITLCLFIIIFAAFMGMMTYTAYTESAYRNTLSGTYTYFCTITTDSPLYNVTLFIPVPVDRTGNSPMASEFSNHTMKGVPADWETTLFDTGKSTLLKITTPAIIPPEGTSAQHPYTITFSSETTSPTPMETRDPVEKSAMFRPVQDLRTTPCTGIMDDQVACSGYNTSVYADYTAPPDTRVTIESNLTGRNTWTIFEPSSNEYHTEISLVLTGKNHGWAIPGGSLATGIGSYDVPGGS